MKVLKANAGERAAMETQQEAMMLRANPHDNLLSLMFVFLDHKQRLSLVTTWCGLGSLLDVVKPNSHPLDNGADIEVSNRFLIGVARQVASGMTHLHYNNVIHRE